MIETAKHPTQETRILARSEAKMTRKLQSNPRRQATTSRIRWLLIASILTLALLARHAIASDGSSQETSADVTPSSTNDATKTSNDLPANHRMEEPLDKEGQKSTSHRRNGRQYDGPLSTSSTGNYAAFAGDTGAYVGSGSSPASLGTGYSTAAAAAASNGGISGYASEPMGANMYSPAGSAAAYHADQMARAGYPPMHGGYPSPPPPPQFGGGSGPLAAMFPSASSGLFSSGFPLMAKGFDVSEIVCTAIAVAIGAVIVGAPFILLYLFVMNQMQGNGGGPSAMGPNGGSISLTGPTSSTNVSGRKKRHTSLPEALFKQLSPLVNNEQVAQTFKALMNSMAKYQA